MNFFEWMQTDNFKKEIDKYADTKEKKMKIDIKKIDKAAGNLIDNINFIKGKLNLLDINTTIKIEMTSKNNIRAVINDKTKNILNRKSLFKTLKDDCKYEDKKHAVIYIITINDFVFNKNLIDDYNNYKENKNSPSMSRLINKNWEELPNKILYVGSSHNIRNRIKQHLGLYKNKDVYALYLNSWLFKKIKEKDKKKNLKIKIDIIDTKNINLTESEKAKIPNYLQIIEDLMWEAYKPLFGKQGAK